MKLFIVVLMTMCVGSLRVYAQDQKAPIQEKRKFEILVDGQIYHSIEEYKRSRRESASGASADLKPKEDRSAQQSYRDFIRRVPDPEHFSFDPAKVRTIDISDQGQEISRKPMRETLAQDSPTVMPTPVVSMYRLIAAVVMARNVAQAEGTVDMSADFHAVSRLFRTVDVGQGISSALDSFDEKMATASAVTSRVHPDKLEESFENTIRDVEVPLLIISGKDKVRVMALSADEMPGSSDEADEVKE